jgi:hypothetical protein
MAFPANAVAHHCHTVLPALHQPKIVRQDGRWHFFPQFADFSLLLLDWSIPRPEKFLNPKHVFNDGFHNQ